MRLKDLFTVPTGQKITEKHLRRVLISSICSILLCMGCLVSTTWALFTVSIENSDNVIEIATVTVDVTIYKEENEIATFRNGGYELTTGTYRVKIRLENNATGPDDLNKQKTPVYVLMAATIGETPQYYCFTFTDNTEAEWQLQIGTEPVYLSSIVTWLKPDTDLLTGEGSAIIGEIPPEESSEPVTDTENEAASGETTIPPADTSDDPTVPSDGQDDGTDGTQTEPANDEQSNQESEATKPVSDTTPEDGTEEDNTGETTG